MDSAPGQVIILLILLFLSGFFSASETALTALNKLRLRHLTEENVKGAKLLSKLVENPSKLLGAILVGNNLVNIAAAALATTLAMTYFGDNKGPFIATAILTPVLLIFGEITPKSFAAENSEKFSFSIRNVIYLVTIILNPIVTVLIFMTNGIIKLLGGKADSKKAFITEEELKTLVNVGHEEGILEVEEKQMIYNVFEFGDSQVEEVMTPRTDMATIDSTMNFEEIMNTFKEEHFSRIPVYEESIDNIIGILNIKDLILFDSKKEKFDIKKYIRDPYFTFEFKSTAELFAEMRLNRIPMAIVLDEYGGTAGLVAMEDLVEEIVGDLKDEYDEQEEEIKQIKDNEFIVEGGARIDYINDIIGVNIESEDFDSIGGFVLGEFGRLPEKGEKAEYNKIKFIIESIDKNRIEKLRIIV